MKSTVVNEIYAMDTCFRISHGPGAGGSMEGETVQGLQSIQWRDGGSMGVQGAVCGHVGNGSESEGNTIYQSI